MVLEGVRRRVREFISLGVDGIKVFASEKSCPEGVGSRETIRWKNSEPPSTRTTPSERRSRRKHGFT